MRINWSSKIQNMHEIAKELNLGLDTFVFWDDSPTEQERMRVLLPDVLTIEVPPDPALYERTLSQLTDFESLSLTDEDRARGRMMAQGRARAEAKIRVTTEEEFLRTLEIRSLV